MKGLPNQLANMDGRAAAKFVAEKIPPASAQQSVVMGAVVAWAREDPAATRQWIEMFPSNELRAQASQVLLGYWLENDPATAQAFAAALLAGAVSNQGSERVAQFLAGRKGRDAVAWAERVEDPQRKSETLAFVLAEWQRHDPDAFRSLLRDRPELASIAPPSG